MPSEPIRVALRVIETLERLGIEYHLGGSFASSLHGVPRQTQDLDLVLDLSATQIHSFAEALRDEFYVEPEMIQAALRRGRSFNLIHLTTGFKIDCFPRGSGAFDTSEFERRIQRDLVDDPPRAVLVKSVEDIILRKLEWYRLGGQVSDRQWTDVRGMIALHRKNLDLSYLNRWAVELAVADLLERALSEG